MELCYSRCKALLQYKNGVPSYLKNNIYYHYSAYNSFVKSFFYFFLMQGTFLLDNSPTGCIIGIVPPEGPLYPPYSTLRKPSCERQVCIMLGIQPTLRQRKQWLTPFFTDFSMGTYSLIERPPQVACTPYGHLFALCSRPRPYMTVGQYRSFVRSLFFVAPVETL